MPEILSGARIQRIKFPLRGAAEDKARNGREYRAHAHRRLHLMLPDNLAGYGLNRLERSIRLLPENVASTAIRESGSTRTKVTLPVGENLAVIFARVDVQQARERVVGRTW